MSLCFTLVQADQSSSDFFWIRRHMTAYIYGMKRSLAFSDVWEHLFPIHHRSLSPNGIQDLNARYVDQLEQVMLRRISTVGAGTERINLVNWVFEVMVCRQHALVLGLKPPLVHCVFNSVLLPLLPRRKDHGPVQGIRQGIPTARHRDSAIIHGRFRSKDRGQYARTPP